MGKALNISTGIVAILALAPWAVYLGGLGKLTDELTDFRYRQAIKQVLIMLEWYVLCAQLVNILFIAIAAFARRLHRVHSLLNMFLAVNTALLILRATVRITEINRIKDGEDAAEVFDVLVFESDPLPYLRALACGQVASAAFNFCMAIMISYAGTCVDHLPQHHPVVAIAQPDVQGKPMTA